MYVLELFPDGHHTPKETRAKSTEGNDESNDESNKKETN